MNIIITDQELHALCAVLADTNNGLTKSELTQTLSESGIAAVDDGHRTIGNGLAFQMGLNKRDWLYNCFAEELNRHYDNSCVFKFIEAALNTI